MLGQQHLFVSWSHFIGISFFILFHFEVRSFFKDEFLRDNRKVKFLSLIHSNSLCLLIGELRPLIFKVIIERYVFLFLLCLVILFSNQRSSYSLSVMIPFLFSSSTFSYILFRIAVMGMNCFSPLGSWKVFHFPSTWYIVLLGTVTLVDSCGFQNS